MWKQELDISIHSQHTELKRGEGAERRKFDFFRRCEFLGNFTIY
jgi:hypothetical protein